MVTVVFPEEREILKEEPEPKLSKELRKEVLTLYKLGLEEYEIRYLINLKIARAI